MDSFIIIEGPVLWLLVLVFMCFVVMFLVAVNKWLKAEQENERKDMLIKKLRADNNELLGYAVGNNSELGKLPPTRLHRATSLNEGGKRKEN